MRDSRNRHSILDNSFLVIVAVVLLAAAVFQPFVHAAGGIPRYIDEYEIPTPNSAPLAITVDHTGTIWFSESNASKLARFDPNTGTFREYDVPTVGDMWGITIDSNENIWLTQYSLQGSVNPGGAIAPGGTGRLIRFNPSNTNFTVIDIPTPGAFPLRVVSDDEGRIWFTELLGNRIGYYDPSSRELKEYTVPSESSGPADLTFDKHGMLWFTESYNQSVARFDPMTGTFSQYHFSALDPMQYVGSPVGLAVTDDGIVWVADHGGNWIVEFNSTSQHVTLYPTHFPPAQVYPISLINDLLVDHEGRVWFVEHVGNSVGFLDPQAEEMVEFPIPTGPISTALWLALAPNGDVWFTEWSTNKIGVVHASLPIPLAVSASEDHIRVPAGGQTSLTLELKPQAGYTGGGTFVSSWPSYNPGDMKVTFLDQNISVSGTTGVQMQIEINASPHIRAGSYVLGLGFDAGTVRVWTMVRTEVGPQPTTPTFNIANIAWLAVGLVIVTLAMVFVANRRIRRPKTR
jgi:virginiamycin B lyase